MIKYVYLAYKVNLNVLHLKSISVDHIKRKEKSIYVAFSKKTLETK